MSSTHGETNLDLLYQAFAPAAPVLAGVADQLGVVQAQKAVVELETLRLVAAAARARTVPASVTQLIDQCRGVTGLLHLMLEQVEPAIEAARELTDRALQGLEPARANLDATRRERATGDLYNRLGH